MIRVLQTEHIALDPHKCEACWKCVEVCPKQVLGKLRILWHKHAKLFHPEACIGCKKCVKACQYGSITAIKKDK